MTPESLLRSTVIDVERNDLFGQLGQLRSPFRNAQAWPYLGDEFQQHSEVLLQTQGTDRWRELGGDRCESGLTLKPDSEAADEVLRRFEQINSGFIVGEEGKYLAVRLIRGRKQGHRFGIGLQLEENTSAADATDGSHDSTSLSTGQVRLGSRAEQLLWLIHAEVMRQRRSLVQLPDLLLKEMLWPCADVPRDWRRDLQWTFQALMNLRMDVINLTRRGWQPRLGARSALLDHVEFSWNLGELGPSCDETCSMSGSSQRHHHVQIGVGHAFLGVLEKCAVQNGQGYRTFDFKIAKDDRSATMPVRPVLNAFVGKKLLGLSPVDRAVLKGILSELTAGETGEVKMQSGMITPKINAPCPLLSTHGRYVSFNGNGAKSGYGYTIEGRKGTGWLYKAGFNFSHDDKRQVSRQLFQSLARLSVRLDIIVCGYSRKESRWYDLSAMLELSRRRNGWNVLGGLLVRIYGPENFLTKLTDVGIDSDESPFPRNVEHDSLSDRLRASGRTQREIAGQLGVSRPFISTLLNSKRPWPPERAREAENLLSRLNQSSSSRNEVE